MSAWGVKPFECDPAFDWLWEFENAKRIGILAQSLGQPHLDDGYLEIDGCGQILAVAEVLYGILFGPRDYIPDVVRDWILEHQELNVTSLILDALRRLILSRVKSQS